MKILSTQMHSLLLCPKPQSTFSQFTVLLCAQAPETGDVHISIGHTVVNLCTHVGPMPTMPRRCALWIREFRATPACMAAMPCLASRNSELACLFHQLAPACVVANGVLRVRGACRIFLVYYVSHVLRTWRG